MSLMDLKVSEGGEVFYRPSPEKIRLVVEQFDTHRITLQRNAKILKVLWSSIDEELKHNLTKMYEVSLDRMLAATPRINFFRRIVNKVSKVYLVPPLRSSRSRRDEKLIQEYVEEMSLDQVLAQYNLVLTACRRCALETYSEYEFGKVRPRVRLLTPDMYYAYSDSLTDPHKPTIIAKVLRQVSERLYVLRLYDMEHWVDVNTDGEVVDWGHHGMGQLPILHQSTVPNDLNPTPDEDTLFNSIRLLLTLGDLFNATQFQSHTTIVTKNAKLPENLHFGPDVIISLTAADDAAGDPSIDTIEPKVQVEKALALLSFFLDAWLDSKDLRVGAITQTNIERAPSAFSKVIDEADASQAITGQFPIFRKLEKALWNLIRTRHDLEWSQTVGFFTEQKFSVGFDGVQVDFNEVSPDMSEERQLDIGAKYLSLGLLSRFRVLKTLKPNLTDADIEKYLSEVKDDDKSEVQYGRRIIGTEGETETNNKEAERP